MITGEGTLLNELVDNVLPSFYRYRHEPGVRHCSEECEFSNIQIKIELYQSPSTGDNLFLICLVDYSDGTDHLLEVLTDLCERVCTCKFLEVFCDTFKLFDYDLRVVDISKNQTPDDINTILQRVPDRFMESRVGENVAWKYIALTEEEKRLRDEEIIRHNGIDVVFAESFSGYPFQANGGQHSFSHSRRCRRRMGWNRSRNR